MKPKAGQTYRSKVRPDFKMVVIEANDTEIHVDVDRQKNNVRETRRLVWPTSVWAHHVSPYELEKPSGKTRKEDRGHT